MLKKWEKALTFHDRIGRSLLAGLALHLIVSWWLFPRMVHFQASMKLFFTALQEKQIYGGIDYVTQLAVFPLAEI